MADEDQFDESRLKLDQEESGHEPLKPVPPPYDPSINQPGKPIQVVDDEANTTYLHTGEGEGEPEDTQGEIPDMDDEGAGWPEGDEGGPLEPRRRLPQIKAPQSSRLLEKVGEFAANPTIPIPEDIRPSDEEETGDVVSAFANPSKEDMDYLVGGTDDPDLNLPEEDIVNLDSKDQSFLFGGTREVMGLPPRAPSRPRPAGPPRPPAPLGSKDDFLLGGASEVLGSGTQASADLTSVSRDDMDDLVGTEGIIDTEVEDIVGSGDMEDLTSASAKDVLDIPEVAGEQESRERDLVDIGEVDSSGLVDIDDTGGESAFGEEADSVLGIQHEAPRKRKYSVRKKRRKKSGSSEYLKETR